MTRAELREAIEKPAEGRVMYFQPHDLVEELIDEVDNMPGALPLLSFALRELFLKYLQRQHKAQYEGITIDRALTQADYEELGGVMRSLTQRADEEYETLVKENRTYAWTIRHVMLRMVALGGGELARRRVPLSELEYPPEKNALVKEVIERFTEARLLVKGEDIDGNFYVEPAHDALVRGWAKLLLWKDREQETLDLRRRLTPAANDWKQDKGFLWTEEEGRIFQLRPFINSNENWLNKVETDFIKNSIEEKRKRLEEVEKQRDEALQGQITALAALSEARFEEDQLGALTHILKAGRILQQLIRSKSQWITQDICLRTEVVLRQILSKVKEFNRLQDKNIPLGMIAKLSFTSNKSILVLDRQGQGIPLHATSTQEMLLLQDSQGIVRYWQLDGSLVKRIPPGFSLVKLSPDRQTFAYICNKTSHFQEQPKPNAIALLNPRGTEIILQEDERDTLMTFAFNPNGQLIASGGWFGILYLWNKDGTKVAQNGTGISLNSIDFSPNSDILVTGSNDGKIRFWNQNGELFQTIEAHKDAIWEVSFSPDGETLASVSTDTTVKIWKTNGTLLTTLNGHKDKVSAACFNSDGQILASASDEGTVRLWRLNGNKLKCLDDHHTGSVFTVRFNPKQPMIATTSGQGQLILWRRDGQLLKAWNKGEGHHGTITALDFSPNGKMFVTAAGDRQVKLWRLDRIDKQDFVPHNLGNHTGENHLPTIFGVSFSSDNQTILLGSGSQDGKGTLELCDSESKSCRIIAEYNSQVLAVCFSPDGQMFALSKGDGGVELWRKEEEDFQFLINLDRHDNLVLAVCFSTDGKFLATGAGTTVKIWQIDQVLNNASTTNVTPTNIPAHTDRVTAVRFSPKGDLIATASDDKTVKLWNLDGTLRNTLHGHNDRVNALDFSTDGDFLASASNDKTAILWNLNLELGLDKLIDYGCDWISGYLTNNPNVNEDDRKVLSPEEFPILKYDSQKWI